ncbi:MAG: hypothetical protein COS34_01435 [Lysobacterales bacterium CG02_land_8_20_14_3_00_62_12]|nr:MAG: hypothetical protein COS34_01435 [Xanthomonadales bacterium CG02_land_8_20_14_3_00_62_12]
MSKKIARLVVTQRKRVAKTQLSPALTSANSPDVGAVLLRLRRVEGQVRGVIRMIEQNQTSDAVAQQLSAARHALDRAFFALIASDLEAAISATGTQPERRRRLAEKIRLLAKYS